MHTSPTVPADLDPAVCEQLSVLERSSPGILQRLVDGFLARQSRAVAEADRHLQQQDLKALRMMAHMLKGSSASLGATALAACASEIERCALAGDTAACGRLLAELPTVFAAAERALRAWVRG